MVNERNQPKIINVSEGIDIVTQLVDNTDDLSSKHKGIYFKYNLGKNQYDFVEEVFFFAPLPSKKDDIKLGSNINLNIPIKKVYQQFRPDTHDSDRDKLLKIIINCDCEYMRQGKTFHESQYEIIFG